jgi:hypothetical protein
MFNLAIDSKLRGRDVVGRPDPRYGLALARAAFLSFANRLVRLGRGSRAGANNQSRMSAQRSKTSRPSKIAAAHGS